MQEKKLYEVQFDICRQLGSGRMLVEAYTERGASEAVCRQVNELYNPETDLGYFADVGEVHKVSPELYTGDDLNVVLDYEDFQREQ